LQQIFKDISIHKKKSSPKAFVQKLKSVNILFNNELQQDAHEMFNFLINHFADALKGKKSWVHELFEGVLTNETRCLNCESVTNRDEEFFDLSVDIENDTSVSSCLRNFSSSEILRDKNKFFCDSCNSLQEAEKRMKIKKLPNILAIHLKRFKYREEDEIFCKLSCRVPFQEELRLFNTAEKAENADRLYKLCAIIVHIGGGPQSGHYIAVAKSQNEWFSFDDEEVFVNISKIAN
jgi:ubiquitin C-terminal hydrolase